MTTKAPLLQVQRIEASYGPIKALRKVSLDVYSGEIVTLIGSNGAGKSTLLMSLFGTPRIQNGTVTFDGHDLTTTATHQIAGLGIALVPEGRHVFPGMTVDENLVMGAISTNGQNLAADKEKMFDIFPRLRERRFQNAGTMSGGEQQMLAIGRALMSRPRLLLLDEPSLGLAPLVVKDIFAVLRKIAASGTTIFLVEQNARRALKLADRGYVLVNGEIKMAGTGEELLKNPQVREAYLGEE